MFKHEIFLMDPATLSAILAGVLPRAIPYLLNFGEEVGNKATDEVAKRLGSDTWETAKCIWGKIGGKLLGKHGGKLAVEEVAKSPEDKNKIASLRKEIEEVLEADQQLASEINQFVKNRINIDITLKNVAKSVVTGADLAELMSSVDVKIKMDDSTESTITGIRIGKQ